MESLRRKIKPFVLRRMKYEVLKELPDKIENTYFSIVSYICNIIIQR